MRKPDLWLSIAVAVAVVAYIGNFIFWLGYSVCRG